jgi:hypothetical protein
MNQIGEFGGSALDDIPQGMNSRAAAGRPAEQGVGAGSQLAGG